MKKKRRRDGRIEVARNDQKKEGNHALPEKEGCSARFQLITTSAERVAGTIAVLRKRAKTDSQNGLPACRGTRETDRQIDRDEKRKKGAKATGKGKKGGRRFGWKLDRS